MRRLLCFLLLPGWALAGPLVPPPGFLSPMPHTAKGQCIALPAPFTASLTFRSKYEGLDRARATLNPDAEKAFRSQTQTIVEFERGISKMVWRYKQSGDGQTLACIISGYRRWADANALTSTQTNHTGRSMRKWALATLASHWLALKFMPQSPLRHTEDIERWLSLLAEQVVRDWEDLPLAKTNNHSYWAAWSVMASAVALNRRDLFDWSLKEYEVAASQIQPDGSLPNELIRGARSDAYHHYALEPLVMIASFAQANQVDAIRENNGALIRLASYVLQHGNTQPGWLEPYCTLIACDNVTLDMRDAMRPYINRRMGGDLTQLYAPYKK